MADDSNAILRRRSSLRQQRRLSLQYENNSWAAPPSGVGISASSVELCKP